MSISIDFANSSTGRIPSSWTKVTLEELSEFITKGATPTTYGFKWVTRGIPFLRSECVTDEGFSENGLTYISQEANDYMERSKVVVGDILISITGNVGRIAIFPKALKRGNINQHIARVRIKQTEICDERFIYYQITQGSYRQYYNGIVTGAAYPQLSLKQIRETPVYLPSLFIQREIASILSSYDDLIENNLQRVKLLEETARITFNERFGKVQDLPKGWAVKKLKEVADINANQIAKDFQGKIKYVDISSVSLGRIDFYTEYEIQNAPGRARRVVKHGDIIWSCVRPNRKSHCLIWNPEIDLIVSTGFAVITPKELPASYLYQHLITDAFVGYLTNRAGGAAYPAVKPDAFEEAEIVIPPKEMVDAFDKIIKPTVELILNLTKQNRLLKEARDILLPRLMTGMIGVKALDSRPEAIAIPVQGGKQKEANWGFKEAVLIAILTAKFGNEKFPLGRKRYTKLSYLFHRYVDNQAKNYLRKAAGPYNPKTKYQGPEKIAHQNGYVVDHKNGNLTGFIAGRKIEEAKGYFENYWSIEYMNWLDSNFRYKSNDYLELYATIDNAMLELHEKNEPVNVEAIKQIIKTEKEWKAKLERDIFSDKNIQQAIDYLFTIFQYH